MSDDTPSRASPGFPATRLRRLRYNPAIRSLVRSIDFTSRQLILPVFVQNGSSVIDSIAALPGHARLSPNHVADEARTAVELGLGGIILFGVASTKDRFGTAGLSDRGAVQKALRAAKEAAPDLLMITDVCCCEYTDHGHCGVLSETTGRVDVDNDATLEVIAKQAVSHAAAGADMVAPSGMLDGMVGAIRRALDDEGFAHVPIMSYSAKFASAFYGPFREAADCAPAFGDRRTYQMDPASDPGQAVREAALDIDEGADIIMVKPALPYLDVIRALHDKFSGTPLAAYCVSGEYSMIKAAAENGWIDEKAAVLEMMTAIRRAGASIVLTYWAKDIARWLS